MHPNLDGKEIQRLATIPRKDLIGKLTEEPTGEAIAAILRTFGTGLLNGDTETIRDLRAALRGISRDDLSDDTEALAVALYDTLSLASEQWLSTAPVQPITLLKDFRSKGEPPRGYWSRGIHAGCPHCGTIIEIENYSSPHAIECPCGWGNLVQLDGYTPEDP